MHLNTVSPYGPTVDLRCVSHTVPLDKSTPLNVTAEVICHYGRSNCRIEHMEHCLVIMCRVGHCIGRLTWTAQVSGNTLFDLPFFKMTNTRARRNGSPRPQPKCDRPTARKRPPIDWPRCRLKKHAQPNDAIDVAHNEDQR